jgi:curved DNA-binding protein
MGDAGAGNFSDFFEMLFGGGAGAGNRGGAFRYRTNSFGSAGTEEEESPGGEDQEASLTITLEDVYRGATKSIALQADALSEHGQPRRHVKNYEVKIPTGATEGTRIRLAGQGAPSPYGGPPGHLYLTLHIAPHPLFKINGHDLEMDLPLAPWEAALGGKITIPAIEGSVTLTIPPGTESGQRLRLRGKGLPKGGSRSAGDLYAVIKIVVPAKLTAKERALLEELARTSTFQPRSW